MEKKISDLIKGDRFFYGMWYDFESLVNNEGITTVNVTNGYDERVFHIIINKDALVKVPYKSSDNEMKDTLTCLLHIYQDQSYGDNVWRKIIEERAEKLTK